MSQPASCGFRVDARGSTVRRAASAASGLADVVPDDEPAERGVGAVDGIQAQSRRSAQEGDERRVAVAGARVNRREPSLDRLIEPPLELRTEVQTNRETEAAAGSYA